MAFFSKTLTGLIEFVTFSGLIEFVKFSGLIEFLPFIYPLSL